MTTQYPDKVYVELTTRCNLRCPMCLKFSRGSVIEEGDLPLALFKKLAPSLAHAGFLVLNGIGEPLLHPDLEEMIALARAMMPAGGRIGFQSNGLLLSQPRALELVAAGLDTICLSVDDLGVRGQDIPNREGHQLVPVTRALGHLARARTATGREVRIGIEVVLRKDTLPQLPALVEWAHTQGVDFIIASHLFSYDGALSDQCLFNPNSYEAIQLFRKWDASARAQGVDLAGLPAAQRKFAKSPADLLVLQLGAAMYQEAKERDITVHFPNLAAQNGRDEREAAACFQTARQGAIDRGIDLFLPPLHAQAKEARVCPFIRDNAVFIDRCGRVMPCHFLWHTGPAMMHRESIQVNERVFGSIEREPLAAIWQKAEYAAFRQEVRLNEYAPCWSCTSGPCADLVNANLLGMHDCYGSHVPCGHCMWGIGWLRCL